jgi:hypothetical protein
VLDSSPEIPANVRVTGLRGVGKTVLLQEFEQVAEEVGWATTRVELEPRHNDERSLSALIRALSDQAIRKLSLAARVRDRAEGLVRAVSWSMTMEDLTLRLDPTLGPQTTSVIESLADAVQVASRHGRTGYALLLDGAQAVFDEHRSKRQQHPLSMLVAAVNALQSSGAPIALVLCGLPTLQANLLRARTYSERMFRGERVDSLSAELAAEAFLRPLDDTGVSADDACVREVVDEVDGCPYFIQLWGAELWDAASESQQRRFTAELLATARPHILQRLDRDFYEGRLATLTAAEQDLLLASGRAGYPPLRVAELRGHTTKDDRYVNVLMGRLTEAGVVYREAKGVYRYTAPQFHEFLVRHVGRSHR